MRSLRNRLFVVVCVLATGVAAVVLVVLLGAVLYKGWDHLTIGLLTNAPSRRASEAGLKPAIVGSIYLFIICAVVAIPIGVGAAILMEEFPPRGRVMRALHRLVQLNITNLAGVPSIVYGIIGLTIFANMSMFPGLGTSLSPRYAMGVTWYDEFYDEAGNLLRVRTDRRDAPATVVTNGMTATLVTDTGVQETITVRVMPIEAIDALHDDEQDPSRQKLAGVLSPDAEPQRVSEKAWYYVQLPFGRGVLAGGLTLMLVVLPIIITVTQEALRAVPNTLREGALACGATRWQMVWKMTLPAAVQGIMTGSILAMSRAIGEAAPVLILCGIVYISFLPANLMDDFTVMPLQIYNWASRPQEAFHGVAAAGIIVLLVVLLSFNALAIFIRQKFNKPLS